MKRQIDNKINNFLIMILIAISLTILGTIACVTYFKKNKVEYINYEDKTTIDYNVYLKDNNFYNSQYQQKNKEYVTSLIDYIETSFNYKLSFDKNIKNNYSYNIVASANVYNKGNHNLIYNYDEILLSQENITNNENINISETQKIDYNKYNDIIKNFISTYNINNTESEINIKLYVDINNIEYNNQIKNIEKKEIGNISIPLNTQTISIDTSKEIQNEDKKIELSNKSQNKILLLTATSLYSLALIDILLLIIYITKEETSLSIYKRKIKTIYSDYESNIQRVENGFTLESNKLVFVKEFNDILEIGTNLKKPILSIENKRKTGTLFLIPPENGIVFAYILSSSTIKAKKEGKASPKINLDEYLV